MTKSLVIALVFLGSMQYSMASVIGSWRGTLTWTDQNGPVYQWDDCEILISQSESRVSVSDPKECTLLPSETTVFEKHGTELHRQINSVDTVWGNYDEFGIYLKLSDETRTYNLEFKLVEGAALSV